MRTEQVNKQEECNSEHFMKLRRLKEEMEKPESILDVALDGRRSKGGAS